MIKLGQRIGHAKIIVVVLENFRRAFQRVTSPFRFTLCRDHSNLDASHLRFDQVQFTSHENVQITRHRRSHRETHFLSPFNFSLLLNRHVRDSEPVFGNNGGELKARAKARLVPAWEKPARVGRFELRAEYYFFRAGTLFLIWRVKKSLALLIDLSGKIQRERVIPDGELGRQRDREQLLFLVDLDRAFWQRLVVERGARDFHLEHIKN